MIRTVNVAKRLLLVLAMACAAHETAIAGIYRMSFTATDFKDTGPILPPSVPPDRRVSGVLEYEAPTIDSFMERLTSISLTIDGHEYSLSEVGIDLAFPGMGHVGALSNGVRGASSHTDDFLMFIAFPPLSQAETNIAYFTYTTAGSPGIYDSFTISKFSINPIPEPSTALLSFAGLSALGVAMRRRLWRRPAP